jgi:hypothetical protein
VKYEECPCFYYNPQEGSDTCECGHELNEHDKNGDCQVEITDEQDD